MANTPLSPPKPPAHLMHAVLTVLTAGLWVIVWIGAYSSYRKQLQRYEAQQAQLTADHRAKLERQAAPQPAQPSIGELSADDLEALAAARRQRQADSTPNAE